MWSSYKKLASLPAFVSADGTQEEEIVDQKITEQYDCVAHWETCFFTTYMKSNLNFHVSMDYGGGQSLELRV